MALTFATTPPFADTPDVVFVGTQTFGLHGRGKMIENWFLPRFKKAAEDRGIRVAAYSNPRLYRKNIGEHQGAAVILVYCERWVQNHRGAQEIRELETLAKEEGKALLIANQIDTGFVVGNKMRTAQVLSSAGVPMPELAKDRTAEYRVFSNEIIGAGRPTHLVESGRDLDPDRYNTRFIDTRHEYGGRLYHVCLRAMCVGETLYSVLVRARLAERETTSVHAINTPRDAGLINHLYDTVVTPRYDCLTDLCKTAGRTLGLGFYCHDLLPENSSDAVYLCETGFKFDNPVIRGRLAHIWHLLRFSDVWDGTYELKMTQAFLRAANLERQSDSTADSRPHTS